MGVKTVVAGTILKEVAKRALNNGHRVSEITERGEAAVSDARKWAESLLYTYGIAGRNLYDRLTGRRRRPETLKGIVAGVVGGLVGSLAMNQFHALMGWMSDDMQQEPAEERGEHERGGSGGSESEHEPATVKAAEEISEGVLGHELSQDEKQMAGPLMHYAFGASVGAVYGAISEHRPEVRIGNGLPFGTAVWLVADETAVPILGLSDSPWNYPISTHASSFAAHLVYGATTEIVRELVRRRL